MLTKEQIEAIKEDRCERLEDGEVIDCKFCVHVDYCGINKLADQAALAIDLQAEVDRLKAERRWMPVSERLPKPDSMLFFQMLSGNVFSGRFDGENFIGKNVTSCPSCVRQYLVVEKPEGSEKHD